MVHALKYEYIAELGYSMGAMLAQAYSAREHTIMHPACIVPVPIHVKRLRDRGFNQSELIARAYAEAVDMPLIVDALTRGKNTQSQVHLSRVERMENMSGAFMARNTEKIRGRTVYLIDDVYTTGATLYEAARILQDAGARNVIGVTFAREE
jgi:ComF family protein